jgi:hypothetical protein
MKKISLLVVLMIGAVFPTHASAAPQTVVSCPFASGAGDRVDRGFYVTNYAGTNIDQVTLEFGTSAPGTYTITLTARSGTYDGSIIGSKTASVYLSDVAAATPLTFDLGGAPVAPGSTITFSMTATGPGTVYHNDGAGAFGVHDMTCPGVTETAGTTPPLDAFRRASMGLTITQLPPPGITSISPRSGSIKGGTKVTIIGQDFAGTSVSFGSKPAASFTVNSPTLITAISPPGSAPGPVDVSVTTGGGKSAAVAADEFTYTACVVPKLKGKTLTNARKALTKANCKLGKVKPEGQTSGHVKTQSPKPGTVLAPGSKVRVKLG